MNLYESIFVRKSVRKYNMKALEEGILSDIMSFAKNLPMIYEGLSVEYRLVDTFHDPIQLGGLFSIKAPYYLCLYTTKEEGYGVNSGNLIQTISLYLTSKGIGSCILGYTKMKKGTVEVIDHEHVVTLAFGESEGEIYRTQENAKRAELKDITVYKEEIRRNIGNLLDAARLAPSSMNSQPWKFVVYDNRIHIFSKKQLVKTFGLKLMSEIDMGCCIAHLLVAADELWVDNILQNMNNISAKSFHKYDYVITMKMI